MVYTYMRQFFWSAAKKPPRGAAAGAARQRGARPHPQLPPGRPGLAGGAAAGRVRPRGGTSLSFVILYRTRK